MSPSHGTLRKVSLLMLLSSKPAMTMVWPSLTWSVVSDFLVEMTGMAKSPMVPVTWLTSAAMVVLI